MRLTGNAHEYASVLVFFMRLLDAGLIFISGVLFLFPRLEPPRWSLLQENHKTLSGLSDTLKMDTMNKLALSYDLAFRVKFEGKIPPPNQRYWRGVVYLQNGSQLCDSTLSNCFLPQQNLDTSFTNLSTVNNALAIGDFVILDACGRPIVLQVPSVQDCQTLFGKNDCARLVSAGSGNGIGLNNGAIDSLIQDTVNAPPHLGRTGDDRILYLNIPTPSGEQNTPCDLN